MARPAFFTVGSTNTRRSRKRFQLRRLERLEARQSMAADIAVIASRLGVEVDVGGLIETRVDVDVYQFTTAGGDFRVDGNPFDVADAKANLDLSIELIDATGSIIAASNPGNLITAALSTTRAAGTYYLAVDGVGSGNPLTTGYSDYGSLGWYTLVGSFIPTGGDENGGGEFQSFSMNVGEFYTGDFQTLFFVNDNDAGGTTSQSQFRNVRIFEESTQSAAPASEDLSPIDEFRRQIDAISDRGDNRLQTRLLRIVDRLEQRYDSLSPQSRRRVDNFVETWTNRLTAQNSTDVVFTDWGF